jgi:phenylpropionate dioxygenase-like ring-hydroxylating dioxygenase large terminal subunit
MFEHTLWHPVASASELDDASNPMPRAAELLEQRLVLWRDGAGRPHAWSDHCPHRGARLSLGRVQGGQLECPYHGWCFAPGGQVVSVPAVPDFVPPATHHARVHEVQERHGLLWVRLEAGEPGHFGEIAEAGAPSEVPPFAAESDARLRKVNCGPYDVATSAPRIVENFLDMAHFGFVHEGWLGSRGHTAIADHPVQATPTGLLATQCLAWQPQSSLHAQGGAMVEYTYEVNAPYTAILTKVPEAASVAIDGFRESIALFICPVAPERSRVWFLLAMNDFTSPDSALQAFQHTIFTQDQPVLESQWPKRLPISEAAPVKELHSAADRASAAYRRYLRERGIGFGVC